MKNLLPVNDPSTQLINEDEIINIRYFAGYPAKYRVSMKDGVLSKNDENLTKKGESFVFIPIAYRKIREALFGQAKSDWVEVFFFNQRGHLCQFMLNKHNVDAFVEAIAEASIYEDLELGQFALELSFAQKSTIIDGQSISYYTARFKLHVLDEANAQVIKTVKESITEPIYRADITNPEQVVLSAENWYLTEVPAKSLEEELDEELEVKKAA